MLVRVWKSLDKPSSLLGLRGAYGKYLFLLCGVMIFPGVIVGSLTEGVWGFLLFVLGCAGVYLGLLSLQASHSAKELSRITEANNLPDYIQVPPKMMRNYNYDLEKEK